MSERSYTREPVGGDSLYYARHGDGWVTAKDIDHIVLKVGAGVHLPALARWVASIEEPTSHTLFAGIHRLKPCQTLVIDGIRASIETHIPPLGEPPTGSLDALASALRDRVWTSATRALENSQRAGILVGGIDSCGLAAVALSHGAPVTLLTFTHKNNDPDEPYVEQLANKYGAQLIKLDVEPHVFLMASFLVVGGYPWSMPDSFAYLVAARALRNVGADRMLTGIWGDDMLGGHPERLGSLVLRHRPLLALKQALRMKVPHGKSAGERLMEYIVRPNLRELLPGGVRSRRRKQRVAKRFSWTKPAFLELLEETGVEQEELYRSARSGESLFRARATSASLADLMDLRRLSDAVMGLQQHYPLVDLELARFTSSLPYEVLNCDGLHRGLWRRALRGLLPESVRMRVGKANMAPDGFVFIKRELDRPLWRERFSLPHLTKLGWVDPVAFRARMASIQSMDDIIATWPFLAADAFLQDIHDR